MSKLNKNPILDHMWKKNSNEKPNLCGSTSTHVFSSHWLFLVRGTDDCSSGFLFFHSAEIQFSSRTFEKLDIFLPQDKSGSETETCFLQFQKLHFPALSLLQGTGNCIIIWLSSLFSHLCSNIDRLSGQILSICSSTVDSIRLFTRLLLLLLGLSLFSVHCLVT